VTRNRFLTPCLVLAAGVVRYYERKLNQLTVTWIRNIFKGKKEKRKKNSIFFLKDETFKCLTPNSELKFHNNEELIVKKEFSYKLRPCYGSEELLIEFIRTGNAEDFIKVLEDLLSKYEFIFGGTSDIWMNDEIWIHISSPNGKAILTKDIYDFIFILGNDNQIDILRIDEILLSSGRFHKEEVNFDDYKTKE